MNDIVDQLEKYIKENPDLLNSEEKKEIRVQLTNSFMESLNSNKVGIPGLLLDFFIHEGIIPSEEDKFLEYITNNYPKNKFQRVLEVSSGKVCSLAQKLKKEGYRVTAMDPDIRIRPSDPRVKGVKILKRKFTSDFTTSQYDVILGFNACPVAGKLLNIKDKPVVFTICDRPDTDDLDIDTIIRSKQDFMEELKRRNGYIENINGLTIVDNSRILNMNKSRDDEDDER
jgi:hypothetical protein